MNLGPILRALVVAIVLVMAVWVLAMLLPVFGFLLKIAVFVLVALLAVAIILRADGDVPEAQPVLTLSSLLAPDRRWMDAALRQAERALGCQEVPVGAVVTRGGQIIGRGHNQVEMLSDPTAHAEMIAITAACETLQVKSLTGCCLYVTLEPCPMCAGAIVLARLDRLVFGALDEKSGSASTLYNIVQDARLNHRVEVVSGLEAVRSAQLLQAFFSRRRGA